MLDHWWHTETGWATAGNSLGLHHLPVKDGLPTRAFSGRALSDTIQKIAGNKEYKMPAIIDDPVILDEILQTLRTLGYVQERRAQYMGSEALYSVCEVGHVQEGSYRG